MAIDLQPGDGKKPKRGPFKGPGTVTFSKNHDNGKFNHGFKFGKCLKAFNETVMKISGVFDNDKLQVQAFLVLAGLGSAYIMFIIGSSKIGIQG